MDTRPIRFFHGGRIVEVSDAPATRTVLQWLREDMHLTGTKEGCAEGDCGACTVVLGRLGGDARLQLQPVDACILLLPMLDGKALFTVEDVQGDGGALHPVQRALVEHDGSQCGFCTPGIVMSLWAQWQDHRRTGGPPSRQQVADALAGNLCRCTGYRPVLDAAQDAARQGDAPLDDRAAVAALVQLAQDPPLAYRDAYWAPRRLDQLQTLLAAHPQARLVAGATDIGLLVTKQLRALPALISLAEVAELRGVHDDGQLLRIGAAASLEQAWSALATRWPGLRDAWLRFASPPIRHAGTMGGNIANGSPIGDAAPVLMALDAEVELRCDDRSRRVPLDAFCRAPIRQRLRSGEYVQALLVPLPQADLLVQAYKVARRRDSDISTVFAALAIAHDGDRVRKARFAFGGMAATVLRAARAEAVVTGATWTETTLHAAMAALEVDLTPWSDVRASAPYRLQVAQNLLRRFWLQTRRDDPLAAQQLDVWADGGAG